MDLMVRRQQQQMPLGKKLCAMSMAAGNAGEQPKTLYRYCNIGGLEHAKRDVKNLIAQIITGRGGWRHKKAVISHEHPATAIAVHPKGSLVVAGYSIYRSVEPGDKVHADVWDIESNMCKSHLYHGNDVKAAACSTTGSWFATGSDDSTACIWDLNGKEQVTLPHRYGVSAVACNQTETRLATGSVDGEVRTWDLKGKEIARFSLGAGINSVAMHPTSETMLVVGLKDKQAIILDATRTNHSVLRHWDSVEIVAFNRQGTRVLTVAKDNSVKLWDLAGNMIANTSYKDDVYYAGLLQNADHVATEDTTRADLHAVRVITASKADESVNICDYFGNALRTLKGIKDLRAVALTPDGGLLATACSANTIVWEQYTNPTLDQLLLRIAIDDYSKGCRLSGQDTGITPDTVDTLPAVIATKLNLIESEITQVWSTIPARLKKSIVLTLIYRAQKATYDQK